jgi:hypothetical protein
MAETDYPRYKKEDWHLKFSYEEVDYDYDKMVYIDNDGKPITGWLENYWYYKEGDDRNWQLVIDGKRVRNI